VVQSRKKFCCNIGKKARNCNLSEQMVVTAVVLVASVLDLRERQSEKERENEKENYFI
jgi:hypothetical protein